MNDIFNLIDKLQSRRALSLEEYELLISSRTPEAAEYLRKKAEKVRRAVYGNKVFIRGLIEISNVCKNNCYYCGIRAENKSCLRYSLNYEEIMLCCISGYDAGFRTFVLQGGENESYSDEFLCSLISDIKEKCPDCAVTLSLGERSPESYIKLFYAGADRYLLRHEAADKELYEKLHPENMSYENRMECLKELKRIGYQTGCGFMVGAPYQTAKQLAKDLQFVAGFMPQMCGIGPFIPHKDTAFANEAAGSAELTCYLLSIIRLANPQILLPATTALSTVANDGTERGILAGANVVMPNLSPLAVRGKYDIYNNKRFTQTDAKEQRSSLEERMKAIGYEVVTDRGDYKKRPYPILNAQSRELLKKRWEQN